MKTLLLSPHLCAVLFCFGVATYRSINSISTFCTRFQLSALFGIKWGVLSQWACWNSYRCIIRSEIMHVISKSNEHVALLWFEITSINRSKNYPIYYIYFEIAKFSRSIQVFSWFVKSCKSCLPLSLNWIDFFKQALKFNGLFCLEKLSHWLEKKRCDLAHKMVRFIMVIEPRVMQFGLKSQVWFQTKIAWHEVQLPLYYIHFKIAQKDLVSSNILLM